MRQETLTVWDFLQNETGGTSIKPEEVLQQLYSKDILHPVGVTGDSGDEYQREPTSAEIDARIRFYKERPVTEEVRAKIKSIISHSITF